MVLTLSMLSHFSSQYNLVINGITFGVNKGFDKVRFVAQLELVVKSDVMQK